MEIRPWHGAVHAIEVVLADVLAFPDAQIGYREQFRGAVFVFLHEPDLVRVQQSVRGNLIG